MNARSSPARPAKAVNLKLIYCFFEAVSSFVETEKTDIRYVISYFGQSRFFEVLPLFVL